jgi:hypothetical protein
MTLPPADNFFAATDRTYRSFFARKSIEQESPIGQESEQHKLVRSLAEFQT